MTIQTVALGINATVNTVTDPGPSIAGQVSGGGGLDLPDLAGDRFQR